MWNSFRFILFLSCYNCGERCLQSYLKRFLSDTSRETEVLRGRHGNLNCKSLTPLTILVRGSFSASSHMAFELTHRSQHTFWMSHSRGSTDKQQQVHRYYFLFDSTGQNQTHLWKCQGNVFYLNIKNTICALEWASYYIMPPPSNKVSSGRIPRPPSRKYSSLSISAVNITGWFAYYLKSSYNYWFVFLPENRNLWLSKKLSALLIPNGIQGFWKVQDYEIQIMK